MVPGEGLKIFADGNECDGIPLWKALALFTSDDLDEGLKANSAVINRAKTPFARFYNLAFLVSLVSGFLFVISLIGLLISGSATATDLFSFLSVATLAGVAAPYLWRQLYQYGFAAPENPLELPYVPDRYFEEFLGNLQKASAREPIILHALDSGGDTLTGESFSADCDISFFPKTVRIAPLSFVFGQEWACQLTFSCIVTTSKKCS